MIRKGFLAGGSLGVITTLILTLILDRIYPLHPPIEKFDIFIIIEYAVYLFFALIPGFVLGGFTGGVFVFTLMKLQHKGVKFYVITCIGICILFLSPLYVYVVTQSIEIYRYFSAGFLDGHTARSFDMLVVGTVIFSATYIFTSFLGSLYLYNQLKSPNA